MTIIFAYESEIPKYVDDNYKFIVWHSNTGRIWSLHKTLEDAESHADCERKAYGYNADYKFHVLPKWGKL